MEEMVHSELIAIYAHQSRQYSKGTSTPYYSPYFFPLTYNIVIINVDSTLLIHMKTGVCGSLPSNLHT